MRFVSNNLRFLSGFFLILAGLMISPARPFAQENSAQVYFFHALKAKEEGRLLVAERLFQKAVEIEPGNPDYHFELGNLYLQTENLILARSQLEQAVMIQPEHLAAHYNLGLVYRELGLAGEAREEFRRVLDLEPANVNAMLQIGYLYQDQGFYEEARQAFREAAEMDFTHPEPGRALEDLDILEQETQTRSQAQMQRSLFEGQQFLRQGGFGSSPYSLAQQSDGSTAQPKTQDALMQAGMVLLQEFLAKRSKSAQEN